MKSTMSKSVKSKKRCLIFLLFGLFYAMACQKLMSQGLYDINWLLGYDPNDDPIDSAFGITVINFFNIEKPTIHYDGNKKIDFEYANTVASNKSGEYLFAYNGLMIENPAGEPMDNGKDMSDWHLNDILYQSGIALPFFYDSSKYCLVHESAEYIGNWGTGGHSLYYSIVDMDKNNGLGKVTLKKSLLLRDTFDYGKVTATRHANGRDWWIVIPKYDSNIYFSFLVNSDTVSFVGYQQVGAKNFAGFGQATFSPDGNYYAKFSTLNESNGAYFDIYDFDRCDGKLSNHHQIHFSDGAIPGGVAFSPNSKFLYLSYVDKIYQIDLHNGSYELNTVAVFDNYFSMPNETWLTPTYFGFMQLARDGRIYCTPAYSSVRELHFINNPNLQGKSCDIHQHSLALPTLQKCLPSFPNYNLGPVDGSVCDSIDLDNHPIAFFRYEPDTGALLTEKFMDLSYFEPTSWIWDFGDGSMSAERDPLHVYVSPGIYSVCLIVRNANSADTACYNVAIGGLSNTQPGKPLPLQVSATPCPFQSTLAFSVPLLEPWQRVEVLLRDVTGREVARTSWLGVHPGWHLERLPQGVYFYELVVDDGRYASGKVLKF